MLEESRQIHAPLAFSSKRASGLYFFFLMEYIPTLTLYFSPLAIYPEEKFLEVEQWKVGQDHVARVYQNLIAADKANYVCHCGVK